MAKSSSFWSPMALGVVVGAVAGVAVVTMNSKGHSAHRLKKHAQRAAHSMGEMAEDLAGWVRN